MISGLDNFDRKHGQEGQRITLTCTVKSGQPEETILWVFNGTVVKVGGPRILRFGWIATRSDNLLNYTCMANNSATSEPLKKTVQLDIACKFVYLLEYDFLTQYQQQYNLYGNKSIVIFIKSIKRKKQQKKNKKTDKT